MKYAFLLASFCAALFAQFAFASSPPSPICGHSSASFFSNAAPAAIPDNGASVLTAQIVVSGLPTFVWDVDVTTFVKHTQNADIDMTITSPQGTVVTLTTDNGGINDDVFFGTLWDDQANPLGQVPAASNFGIVTDTLYSNTQTVPALVPEEPLAAFNGENPNGTWTLSINDDSLNNTGSLSTWALDIVALTQTPASVAVTASNNVSFVLPATGTPVTVSNILVSDPNPIFICGMEVNTKINHSFSGDIDMTVQSPSGRVVTLSTDNGGGNDNVFSDTTWRNLANGGGSLPYVNQSGSVTDAAYTNSINNPSLTPEESLAAFHGENGVGTWTLTISDDANQDGGSLNGWSLNIARCKESDTDLDFVPDSCDVCPNDALKVSPGQCGCGVLDTDSDADGVANCNDGCSADSAKTAPGQCGCNAADTDTDNDSRADCVDGCVTDAAKVAPGTCGCGTADVDLNSNGVLDCLKSAELKVRVTSALGLLAKVKLTKGKLSKGATSAKRSLTALLKDIASFIRAESAGITVVAGKDLTTLNRNVQAKVKKALKTVTKADKAAAVKSLNQLNAALA